MNLKSSFVYLTLFSILLFISGCIITKVKGYTDLDYQNYRIAKIMVRAPNVNFAFGELIEKSLIKEMKRKGVEAKSFLITFPPTRKWTNEQISKQLIHKGFDSIMYINLATSNSSSQVVGYINTGNAYAYSNTAYFGGTTVAIRAFRRNTTARVTVYDIKSANVMWVGDALTKAQGSAFMQDKTTTDSLAKEVVKSLVTAGHI